MLIRKGRNYRYQHIAVRTHALLVGQTGNNMLLAAAALQIGHQSARIDPNGFQRALLNCVCP